MLSLLYSSVMLLKVKVTATIEDVCFVLHCSDKTTICQLIYVSITHKKGDTVLSLNTEIA